MIIIEQTDKIIKYEQLKTEDRKDLHAFFRTHGRDMIIDLGDYRYITYQQLKTGRRPADIRTAYEPDMFFRAKKLCMNFGCSVAVDEEGNNRAVLRERFSTYVHSYSYTYEPDMWFLDEYTCIFLHDCNEYAVALCSTFAKYHWKGSRLILTGSSWEGLIPSLPDLPEIECYYEPELTEESMDRLSDGKKSLHVIFGIPHEETMDRYEQGIMTYDEVMSFTFLFADHRELGEKHPDKAFFVMDGYYGKLGLFAMYDKTVCGARYAKSKGFVPVIRLKRASDGMYQDENREDVWGKFFCQPEGYSIEEVMESRHVFFAPGFYIGSIQSRIMNQKSKGVQLSWPEGIYNAKVSAYLAEKEKAFLPYPEQTLGVLARGTDYVHTHLSNHNIHASLEQLCKKIDEIWDLWGGLQYIYLATEDEAYCRYFKERYKERLYCTDQKRYMVKEGELLCDIHQKAAGQTDGFTLGVEYILSVYLLSKCRSLLASGNCSGVGKALEQNHGKYRQVFIFDLGKN